VRDRLLSSIFGFGGVGGLCGGDLLDIFMGLSLGL
jgi:hypothetical protein